MGLARAASYPTGGFILLLGIVRAAMADGVVGVIAGTLMGVSGLVLFPHGRLLLEPLLGRMDRSDVATVFVIAFLGSAALNVVGP